MSSLPCCVDRAELLYLGRAHVAVDEHVGLAQVGEAFVLDLARGFHPRADDFGRLAALERGQLFEGYAAHVQVDVDAVHDGAGDAFLIALDHARRARTLLAIVAEPSAKTWISRPQKLKRRGKRQRARCAADGDYPVL